jgi:hypothetical protein
MPGPIVDPALEDLSRDLVKTLVAAGDSYTDGLPPSVEHSLTALCTTAHERGVPPEGVLTLLKRTWKTYMSAVDGGYAARDMWYDDLITQCIKEFYKAESS